MDSDYDYIKKQAEIEKELYDDFRKYKSQPNELQKQIQELRKEFSEFKKDISVKILELYDMVYSSDHWGGLGSGSIFGATTAR